MKIITRAEWGARVPRSITRTIWSQRREFVVHHSEGPITQTPRQIQNFHMDSRDWADIGYNFLVDHLGRIYAGRGWLVIGAHCTGHNTSGIGVCVIGSDGADITPAAMASVLWLYGSACDYAGRTLLKRGHGDLMATDCPGHVLRDWVHDGMPAPDAGPAPDNPAPAGWMEALMRSLPTVRRGATGEDVQTVQGLLGARSHPVAVDGAFGPATETAVRAVQQSGHLDVDGVVGPKTWRVLLRVQ